MGHAVQEKSFAFSVRIVRLCRFLRESKNEYVLSKQLLRSGTSIGANIAEAQQAQSKADFIAKLHIALKETAETIYWLRLLSATGYLTPPQSASIQSDCAELEKLLVSILKASKP